MACGCQSAKPCGCKSRERFCTYVVAPFRRVIGIKCTAPEAGQQFLLPRQAVFDCLPFSDGGKLTAMRLYVDPADTVTNQVQLYACEVMDGARLKPQGNTQVLGGPAGAEWLLAATPPSVTPVVKDGETIAVSKQLASQAVPFERGLHLAVVVRTGQAAPQGGLCYVRAVVEGYSFHRIGCPGFPVGAGAPR